MGGLRGLPKLPKRLGSEKTFGVGPFYSYKPGKLPVYVYCLLLSAGNRPAAPWALVEWGEKYLKKKIKHCVRVPRPFILVPHPTFGTESQPAISFFFLGPREQKQASPLHSSRPSTPACFALSQNAIIPRERLGARLAILSLVPRRSQHNDVNLLAASADSIKKMWTRVSRLYVDRQILFSTSVKPSSAVLEESIQMPPAAC